MPRRYVGADAVNPVVASGATSWFDAHDGNGLQQIPSRIGSAVATLGSTTGVDTNDPTWASDGWTFDATDDFISATIQQPTFTPTTGSYACLAVVTLPSVTARVVWSIGTTSVNRFQLVLSGTTTQSVSLGVRGSGANLTSTAQTVGAAGSKAVVGFTLTDGIVNTYATTTGSGALGSNFNITTAGFTTPFTVARFGNFSYATTGSMNAVGYAFVDYDGVALSLSEFDTVATYLLSTFP